MNNRNNIDERLQTLNDLIQRTIDALQLTRQAAQGLTGSADRADLGTTGGLSHTGIVGQTQFVQTAQGLVAVNPGFAPQWIPQQSWGFNGLQHSNLVPAMLPYGVGYGLNHTAFAPQNLGYGMLGQNVGFVNPAWNQGWNQAQGWNGGLSHTGFVAPMMGTLPINYGAGLSHSQFVPNQMVGVPVNYVTYGIPQGQIQGQVLGQVQGQMGQTRF